MAQNKIVQGGNPLFSIRNLWCVGNCILQGPPLFVLHDNIFFFWLKRYRTTMTGTAQRKSSVRKSSSPWRRWEVWPSSKSSPDTYSSIVGGIESQKRRDQAFISTTVGRSQSSGKSILDQLGGDDIERSIVSRDVEALGSTVIAVWKGGWCMHQKAFDWISSFERHNLQSSIQPLNIPVPPGHTTATYTLFLLNPAKKDQNQYPQLNKGTAALKSEATITYVFWVFDSTPASAYVYSVSAD